MAFSIPAYIDRLDAKFGHRTVFFMKRTPEYKPEWLETCSIEHASGNVIDFPVVQDLASLLWIVNLGCIDLNPWYCAL
jgi:DNA primase